MVEILHPLSIKRLPLFGQSLSRALMFLYSADAIHMLAEHLLVPLFALLVIQSHGNVELAGVLWSVRFIAGTLVAAVMTQVKDKNGQNIKLLQVSYTLRTITWAALVLTQSLPVLFVAQMFSGIASGLANPAFNTLVSEHLRAHKHTSNWALIHLASQIMVALASAASGFILTSVGFTGIFLCMALLELVSLLIVRTGLRRRAF